MYSILKQLYLFFGISTLVFTLTGIVIGYSIGFWKCGKVYKKFFKNYEDKFMEEIKNDLKG